MQQPQVDQVQRPGVGAARRRHHADLVQAQAHGGLRAHAGAQRRAAIGVEAARDIDGPAPRGGVDDLDDVGQVSLDRPGEAHAKERIDHELGAEQLGAGLRELRRLRERALDAASAREELAVLRRGAGAMDLQFGEGSALALGPRSTLRLARFDSAAIELFIDGVVDLEVAPLLPGQRFVVHAGAQTVEVRGTQFRVEHRADETRVSCRHGLVHVREGARMVEVGSGLVTSAQTGQPLPSPVKLTSDELISLTLALPYRLPWEPTTTLLSSSARLEVDAPLGHRVRLDGVELGDGAATVRVLRGRHLVETAPAGGAFGRAGWAEVAAGVRIARFEATLPGDPGSAGAALAEGDARRARLRRLAELRGQLDRRQLARCVRSIAKQGVSDTFVTVELAVGREGSIAYLNIVDTDLPAERAECVRSALASLRFGVGPAATLRERVEL